MNRVDYYQLLGVSANATREDIRRAFHCLVLTNHPDRNPNDSLAIDRTRGIIEAYRVLGNSRARRTYDLSIAVFSPPVGPLGYSVAGRSRTRASRVLTGLVGLVLVVLGALALMQAILESSDAQVWRPELVEKLLPRPVTLLPIVSEPAAADFAEWYASEQYQLMLGDRWATAIAMESFSGAATRACLHGDHVREGFYRMCVKEVISTSLFSSHAAVLGRPV